MGNSMRSSSSLGWRPYSQSSNASACWALAARSGPYHFSSAWRIAGVISPARLAASHRLALGRIGGHRIELAVHPRQPFVDLRDVRIQRVHFQIEDVESMSTATSGRNGDWVSGNGPRNIGTPDCLRSGGVLGTDVGNDHHIGGILHQHAGVAMVRMVVVGARRQHDIRIPLAYAPDDLFADGQRGQQLAVVVIQHFISRCPAGAPDSSASAQTRVWPARRHPWSDGRHRRW
jgi:hypothetical protein